MKYIPVTKEQNEEMLRKIGVNSVDELFSVIPDEVLLKKDLNIGEALSEIELKKKLKDLAEKNVPTDKKNFFIGEVAYNHYIPSIVSHLAGQSQFYTSYTPYQPELSQGTLTAIYEFQSYIVNLTGMDVSNASLYDGATAASEAMLML
ncbi:MAG: glycine dehydrogenase, partial [Actinomycetota bacterium]|nr:glycine dehydrogenase [Actinomycetota bacterium]